MTWKTYAAVSGATVLAGWIASSPPANTPAPAATTRTARRAPESAAQTAANTDIEEQAARLQAKMRQEPVYTEPARNPFRFGNREVARAAEPRREVTPAFVEPVMPAIPPPPPVKLSGIAEDRAGDRTERTAVLSSPQGVLLVREGDVVLGQYRVERIEGDAVELVHATDGSRLRLSLKTPNSQ